ncbi:MAG: hypothetical protein V3V23_06805, partial [Dehalococcoidales bacterium]
MPLAIALSLCLALLGCPGPAPPQTPTQAPEPAVKAEFEVSSLLLTPSEVIAGQTVTVSADVKNVGKVDGSYTTILSVDGTTVERTDITVSTGAT